jgi:hypothetical protein
VTLSRFVGGRRKSSHGGHGGNGGDAPILKSSSSSSFVVVSFLYGISELLRGCFIPSYFVAGRTSWIRTDDDDEGRRRLVMYSGTKRRRCELFLLPTDESAQIYVPNNQA